VKYYKNIKTIPHKKRNLKKTYKNTKKYKQKCADPERFDLQLAAYPIDCPGNWPLNEWKSIVSISILAVSAVCMTHHQRTFAL